MSSFDDLPKRDRNHALEDETEAAFQALIAQSSDFVFQGGDRRDYGTDCQIEVVADGHPTNVRLYVHVPSLMITLTLGDLHFSWQDRF